MTIDSKTASALGNADRTRAPAPLAHYESRGEASFRRALLDIAEGARQWRVWLTLSWHDIRQRYRGSMLGPFWLTISTGIMVAAIGLLYGSALKTTEGYFPFLAVGLVTWHLIQSLVSEGCQAFIQSEGFIKQMRLPLSLFAYRAVSRNLIVFAHNLVVYLVVAALFPVRVDASTLLIIPGLFMLCVNGLFAGIFLGMLCARFRDVPQIVASALQIAFFVTPIIWPPSLAASRPFVVYLNPLHYVIEIVRAPLLGDAVPSTIWLGVLLITAVNATAALLFFSWRRHRIAYWV